MYLVYSWLDKGMIFTTKPGESYYMKKEGAHCGIESLKKHSVYIDLIVTKWINGYVKTTQKSNTFTTFSMLLR